MAFHQVFTADEKELAKAYQKLQAENEKLKDKIGEVGNESKKANKEQVSGADKFAAAAIKGVASYASLSTALKAYNQHLERKHQLESDSAKAQQSVAGAQQSFLHNLGFVDAKDRQQALRDVEGIIKQYSIDPALGYSAAGETLSAAGNATPKAALRGLAEAAAVSGNMPDQLVDISQGILDTANMTGQLGEEDMRKNLGLMMSIGETARVTSLKGISQNVIPGMNGVRGFGDTPAEAAAIVSTLSSRTVDRTGAISKTASIALAKQLADFLPEKETGLKSTTERIAHMQSHPELRDKFLDDTPGVSFEKEAYIPIRDLLTAGSAAAQKLSSNRERILSPEAGEKALGEWLEGMKGVDAQRIADFQRQATSAADQALRGNTQDAARGVLRDDVRKAIAASGEGGVKHFLSNFADDWLPESMRAPTEHLERRIWDMEHNWMGDVRTDMTPQERETVRGLKGLLNTARGELTDERPSAGEAPAAVPTVESTPNAAVTSPASGAGQGSANGKVEALLSQSVALQQEQLAEQKKQNNRRPQPVPGAHSEQ